MRRVVITGIGIVSSIGVDANEVLVSLRETKSGIRAAPEYAELGFRSQVEAKPQLDGKTLLVQTAFFAPKGLFGLLYWYGLYPFHGPIFSRMIRKMGLEAETNQL